MSLADFLTRITIILEESGVPFMLTGSLAAAYHAVPRATQDVDLVVDPTPEQLDRLVESLDAASLYVDAEAAAEALRNRTQFNAIDASEGWKADFIMRRERPFSIREFERRRPVEILGLEIPITRVEDLILAKLEWGSMSDSAAQREDVANLVRTAGAALDRDYIEGWLNALGVREEWERVDGSD